MRASKHMLTCDWLILGIIRSFCTWKISTAAISYIIMETFEAIINPITVKQSSTQWLNIHDIKMILLPWMIFFPIRYTASSINEMVLVDCNCIYHIDGCQMNGGYSFTVGSIYGKNIFMNKPWNAGSQYIITNGRSQMLWWQYVMQTTCQ